jgi:hypothetical protein
MVIMAAIGSVICLKIGENKSQLPRRLADARNLAFVSVFAEANAAKAEIAHKTAAAATAKTTIRLTSRELRFARCAYFD